MLPISEISLPFSQPRNSSTVANHPNENGVICKRDKEFFNHSGNRRFRSILASRADEYNQAQSKLDKSIIVSEIMNQVHYAKPAGCFIRLEKGGSWREIDEAPAREKIGQGFRDLLDSKYKFATKAKKRRREHSMKQALSKSALPLISAGAESRTNAAPCSVDLNDDLAVENLFFRANSELWVKIKQGQEGAKGDCSQPSMPNSSAILDQSILAMREFHTEHVMSLCPQVGVLLAA